MECTICKNKALRSVFDLGPIKPSCFPLPDEPDPEPVPLSLVKCQQCGLVQLSERLDPDRMYRQYWYRSGANASMVAALSDVVEGVKRRVDLQRGDIVIDIGCNDGTLINRYDRGIYKIGFDPARTIDHQKSSPCDLFINDYFGPIPGMRSKAKAITAIAMFYDLPDPNQFLRDVKAVLHPDGVFCVQLTDLTGMLGTNAFDNICHEHYQYYSLAVLVDLFARNGLAIFDVETNTVNGSSLRVWAQHPTGPFTTCPTVEFYLQSERGWIDTTWCWSRFRDSCEIARRKVVDYVREEYESRRPVMVLGASTKGNTLLQWFGLTWREIGLAVDVNPDKYGRECVGSRIPILTNLSPMIPSTFLVLPWHFKTNLIERHREYLDAGGSLLFPLPVPVLVTKDGERPL